MNTVHTPLARQRNLGIIAHVDAGKTTLTERLLLASGQIHRAGEVHDGAATTDFSPIERERGITIGAAAVQMPWAPRDLPTHRLTLIDTPGHIDFAIEVERSLRVLDGAVAVFSAVDGVQPQSETVWRQARRHGVPLLAFVNKMDRPGADFDAVVGAMREVLQARPWPLGLPLDDDGAFVGWVDLVHRRLLRWSDDGSVQETGWPSDDAGGWEAAREALVTAVADHDDALADAWLGGTAVDPLLLSAALRRATLAGAGVPVLAGAAFKGKGIAPLLDAIVDYLPSPLDRPAVEALSAAGPVALAADPQGPLAGLLFKVSHQGQSTLAYVRLYSGTLQVGDRVQVADQVQRVGRLVRVQAGQMHEIDRALAGDIVAIVGWKEAASGSTLSVPSQPLQLEAIQAQSPVLAWQVEAASAADLLKMSQGLARLAQEDPSFRVDTDAASGETLLWGMGELHLEVMVQRLREDWGIAVRTGAPKVAYLERPRGVVEAAVGRVVKQTGGQGQFAHVVLALAPREDEAVVFSSQIIGGVVPRAFINAVEQGVRAALQAGPQGHPVAGIEVRLLDGQTHAKDSSEQAFHRAGLEAVRSALAQAGTDLLEPVMRVDVDAPGANVGDVVGDLQRRQGRVQDIQAHAGRSRVQGTAPLARLQGYSTALRSLTQGRASALLQLQGYAPKV